MNDLVSEIIKVLLGGMQIISETLLFFFGLILVIDSNIFSPYDWGGSGK